MDYVKSEFFWIDKSKIGTLFLYTISTDNNYNKIGGKLRYHLQNKYKSNIFAWNKDRKLLISDKEMNDDYIKELLSELWHHKKLNVIKNIEKFNSHIDNISVAEYIISLLNYRYQTKLNKYIKNFTDDSLGDIESILIYDFRAWEVNNSPCISISLRKQLLYTNDLKYYYEHENMDIKDIQVKGIYPFSNGNSTGRIVKIAGKVKDDGERLLELTTNVYMKQLIKSKIINDPEQYTVSVAFRADQVFEYIMQSLRPVITTGTELKNKDYTVKINKMLKIEPDIRYEIISGIFNIVKESGLLARNVDEQDELFGHVNSEYINPDLKIGSNKIIAYDNQLYYKILKSGLYQKNKKFEKSPLKIVIINNSGQDVNLYISELLKDLVDFGIHTEIVDTFQTDDIYNISDAITEKNPDIVLIISGNNFTDKDYSNYKSRLASNDIQSQHIRFKTLTNKYSYPNIILAIMAKTGNIPYVLNNEKYTDYIVGIDISRETKKRNVGTMNVGAMTSLYIHDGSMIEYRILDHSIEGETIPKNILYDIYMDKKFQNKNVIFHRDGPFRGDEIAILSEIAEKLKSHFYFIEINKRNTPRLYKYNNTISNPDIGTYLKINDNEYIIITSTIKSGTTRPLRIKLYNVDFEIAMKSIYNLLVMDYGSQKPPRIPVTIHYSDKIAYNGLHNIIPKTREGNIPYWL